MRLHRSFLAAILSSAVISTLALPGIAQTGVAGTRGKVVTAPDYSSGAAATGLSNNQFNTPESDGRPGEKFYKQGMAAYHHGDTEHAIYMLKLAAYWAYAPAAYNLGVMYFQGEGGVPVNRPLGTAWMFIAAERGASEYVNAGHMLVAKLDYDERTKALELLKELQPKYGDKSAMRRAKAQWAYARTEKTGTRVGGAVGELHVGASDKPGFLGGNHLATGKAAFLRAGWGYMPAGSLDGSVAYRQFEESENPYDPIFLKNRTGTATVGPLEQVDKTHDARRSKEAGSARQPAASSSSHPPRSA